MQGVLCLACGMKFSFHPTPWSKNTGFKSKTVMNIKIDYFFAFKLLIPRCLIRRILNGNVF